MPETHLELTWRAIPDAGGYRILIRDEASGEYVSKEQFEDPRCSLPLGALDPARRYQWRPQSRKGRGRPWSDVLPLLRLPLEPPAGTVVTELSWPDTGAAAYRVVVRDDTAGEIALKDGVQGTRYAVRWTELDPTHHFRYRVQEWRDGAWENTGAYAPLNPPLSLIRTVTSESRAVPAGGDELLFLFTVDTEVNLRYMERPSREGGIEHQIFCRHGERNYGIGYMMDLLDGCGFTGTFFLDILAEYQFGEGSLEPVVEAIKGRGHDVQLHLHSAPHLRYAESEEIRGLNPALRSDDPDQFRRALALAVELFERRVGERAVAYRSGGYNLCDGYFGVLEEFDLLVDASLYPFKGCRTEPWMWTHTQPFKVGKVLEVPVSWLIDERPTGSVPQQFTSRRQDSGQQSLFTGMPTRPGMPTTLVYLAHSYSLLSRVEPDDKEAARQMWNETLRSFCPPSAFSAMYSGEGSSLFFFGEADMNRVSLLERSLRQLAARADVRGIGLAELRATRYHAWDAAPPLPVDPIPVWRTTTRAGQTVAGRRYSASFLAHLEEAHVERAPAGA